MTRMIDQLIYQKYYEGAIKDGVIWCINEYAQRKGLAFEDEDAYTNPEINEHGQAIEAVLTYEIAIYVFRRLNGPWGEVLDELYRLRSSKINEYREATGYNIDTENEFD